MTDTDVLFQEELSEIMKVFRQSIKIRNCYCTTWTRRKKTRRSDSDLPIFQLEQGKESFRVSLKVVKIRLCSSGHIT